jgi:hypothetical protein
MALLTASAITASAWSASSPETAVSGPEVFSVVAISRFLVSGQIVDAEGLVRWQAESALSNSTRPRRTTS